MSKKTKDKSKPRSAPTTETEVMVPRKAGAATAEASEYKVGDPGEFARNMVRVGIQSQRLLADYFRRQAGRVGHAPLDPLNIGGAFTALLRGMVADPSAVMEAQFDLWRDYMGLWERTARRMMGSDAGPVIQPAPGDKRFRDKEWQENQIFDFIKQSYLLTANWLQNTVAKVDSVDAKTRRRIRFLHRSNSSMRLRRPILCSQIPKFSAQLYRAMARTWFRVLTIFWRISIAARASSPSAKRPMRSSSARISRLHRARRFSAMNS